jgi:mgtE-like transporter
MRQPTHASARVRAFFGTDAAAVRQSLVALALNSSTSLIAGAFLSSITGTLDKYPGLLVLVPAAIGLRGNIFGAFGNRMSTAIHTGTFRWSLRREAVLGQSVLASVVLTMGISLVLAVVAWTIAGIEGSTIGVLPMATISIAGGLLGSVVVLVAALGLTGGAVRYGWDLDNVTAPLVSTLGDVLTLPALYLATFLVGMAVVSNGLGVALVLLSLALLAAGWRSPGPLLRQIVRESVPVLVVAGCVSAGALGGILSGRLSSKLFLGLVPAAPWPNREGRRDLTLVLALALPVYVFNGAGAHLVGLALGRPSPGLGWMVAVSLLGGALAMLFVVVVAYYGTIVAYRTGVDPDTYGIPVVSSSVDLVGALALVLAIVVLGVA